MSRGASEESGQTVLGSGPGVWATTVLPDLFLDDLFPAAPGPRRSCTIADLVSDDADELRRLHARLVDEGATKQAASHYLVGWYAGFVASAVGYGMATAGAGVLFAAEGLRFEVVEEGYPDRLTLAESATTAVVPPGHPWAGLAGVSTAVDGDGLRARTLHALVGLLTPIVTACHSMARTRVSSLWNEVADGLGTAVAHQQRMPVTAPMIERLAAFVAAPGAPWDRAPRLSWATSPTVGTVHVAQKGGCCLAFTERPAPDADDDHDQAEESDPLAVAVARYRELFPEQPGAKRYCSTCRFREADDVDARQLFWAEHRRTRTSTAG